MTRGNQREIDRQRAQKKQDEKLKAMGRVRSVNIYIIFAIIRGSRLIVKSFLFN
jgi:hypothetical protein